MPYKNPKDYKAWIEANRKKMREYWRVRQAARKHIDRDKQAARTAVAHAIRSGKMIRSERCARCNEPRKTEAHHDDYSQPLIVVWLCRLCHVARHKEITNANS